AMVFLFLALGVGVIGNIAGIGGGVLLMLVFLFAFKINPVIAGGLSLLTIIASTVAGSAVNARQGAIDKRLFYAIGIPAGIGAVAGSLASYFVAAGTFKLFFGVAIFCIGLFSFSSARLELARNRGKAYISKSFIDYAKDNEKPAARPSADIGLTALVAGILAGLFGIGIGGIMGTFLTAIKHIHPKVAFSSVVAAMIVTSLIGAFVHFARPGTDYIGVLLLASLLMIGGALGGFFGAYLSGRMSFGRLRLFQSYIVMFFGILAVLMSLLGA
ncbi:MAG: sulfite exporter TauE/SafE family protein, partial [Candidatus Micrarchaeaceae archaeon]